MKRKQKNIMQCKSYTWVTRGTKTVEQKCGTKNCGTKFGEDPRTLGDGQVQKGQKNSGTKLVGTLRDTKCQCKKVSGTKTAEQNSRIKIVGEPSEIGSWGSQVQVQ